MDTAHPGSREQRWELATAPQEAVVGPQHPARSPRRARRQTGPAAESATGPAADGAGGRSPGLGPAPAAGPTCSPTCSPTRLLAQVGRFGAVGLACTLAYAVLYLVLREPVGPQTANLVALLVTAVANTAANRVFTFEVRGREDAARHQMQGLVVFALCWALTGAALALLHTWAPSVSQGGEVVVLCVANLAGTVLRFLLLRAWVFRHRAPALSAPGDARADTADGRADRGGAVA